MVEKNDFEKFIEARKMARAGNYDQAIELAEKIETKLRNKLKEAFI